MLQKVIHWQTPEKSGLKTISTEQSINLIFLWVLQRFKNELGLYKYRFFATESKLKKPKEEDGRSGSKTKAEKKTRIARYKNVVFFCSSGFRKTTDFEKIKTKISKNRKNISGLPKCASCDKEFLNKNLSPFHHVKNCKRVLLNGNVTIVQQALSKKYL